MLQMVSGKVVYSRLVSRQGRTKPYKCRPGWNDHARDLHTAARECFIMWIDAGRPKHGPVFDLMKTSRARFKYAIRFLKNHECQLRKDSLAKKLSQSRPDDFWKEIRQVNNCNIPLPNSIEDVTGIDEITELWRSHFKQLFNCIRDIDIQQIKCDAKYTNDIVVEVSEVENAIKCLDINKTCGMDGIYAEHLKHCDKRIVPLLAMCITVFFCTWIFT